MQLETKAIGDLVLRRGLPQDLEQIVALNVGHNGPDTDPMVRAAWDQVGPELFSVVADGDGVVSTLVLLADELALGGVTIPLGRPEFVVTAPGYRGRGLVRKQMDMVHAWSAERGDLAQMITGIPYFYRQFGYEYATKPTIDLLMDEGTRLDVPAGWTVRPMQHDDVTDVVRMQELAHASFELVIPRSAEAWHAHLDMTVDPFVGLVGVTPDGRVAGYGLSMPGGGGPASRPWITRMAVDEPAAAIALVAHAKGDREIGVAGRPGTLAQRVLEPLARLVPSGWEPYFRVPDPVAFMRAIRSVLDARIAASAFAGASLELFVSFYRSSLTVRVVDGRVTEVDGGPGEQNPLRRDGVGVPPDLVATLLLGGVGSKGMAERFRDVELGTHEALMEVLFPLVAADYIVFT